jgi:BASS family bile acid:Na+ symporter
MTVDKLINVLVIITLVEMMAAIGLRVPFVDLLNVIKSWRLVGGAVLTNYLGVPAVTVGLLILFDPDPMVAAGFLILAVCPGAPYGPPLTAIAKGNVAVAVGLMVMLAASSAVLAPLLLHFLVPLLSSNKTLEVDALKIVGTLLMTQLVPLCLGVAIRQYLPVLADYLQGPAGFFSKILNLAVVALILITQFDLLMDIRARGLVGMLALLISSWLTGWLLGGSDTDTRKAMTVTTSLRNVGVGLVIASDTFAGTPAVTATLAYGLFAIVGTLLLALLWPRHATKAGLAELPMQPGLAEAKPNTER